MNIVNYTKDGLDTVAAGSKKVMVKIDNSLFSIHTIVNKNLNPFQAKKSIPLNIEQDLLDDIEDLDFFIKKTNDVFNAIVINKNILIDIKDIAKDRDLEVIGVYLSFMFLPYVVDKISYIKSNDNIIFRDGNFCGGEVASDLFFVKFDEDEIIESPSEVSIDYYKINLLEYSIADILEKFVKPYIVVFSIFLLAFLLNIAITIWQNTQNEVKLNIIKSNNKILFTKMFPDITAVVDIKVQTSQQMQNLELQKTNSKDDFLSAIISKKIDNKQVNSIIFDKTIEVK